MQEGKLPLSTWVREGLRAGFLLRPRVGAAQPSPWQLLALLAAVSALELALGRLEIPGDAEFDLRGWLAPWWSTGVLLLIGWWALPKEEAGEGPRGLASWFALWAVAIVPANCVSQLLSIAQARGELPAWVTAAPITAWGIYLGLWAWTLAVVARISTSFHITRRRAGAVVAAFMAVFAVTAWQFPDRAWKEDAAQAAAGEPEQLALTQELFETQQALAQRALELKRGRPDTVNVWGIVFSPYAKEDVFLREGNMVRRVLEERFDAAGRVVQLANHAGTADTLPWATLANLERAADAIGRRMDRDRDVLVVYLTSHGANDFKLAAANPPLEVDAISPGELRQALDNAGIRNRVVVISACYSGGWVGPLSDEHTLVMTAADAAHTSYGCGRLSELTFFGRAMFDEQLRRTHSFEQAFAAAVPVIREREQEAGKDDGFSNPQISGGEKLKPLLRELEDRLGREAGK